MATGHASSPPGVWPLRNCVRCSDTAADFGFVEEGESLLVAQHLQGWLADNREVQGGAFWGGQREHDLLRKCGLARAWRTRDQVEAVFRNPAAKNLVQPAHARRKLV